MKQQHEIKECLDDVVDETVDEAQQDLENLTQYVESLMSRRIIIDKEISSDIVQKAAIPLLDLDDGSDEVIEIIINTPGGSVFDGMVLCDIIDRLHTPTVITALGCAFSMGFLILSAGKDNPYVERRCYPFSVGLLHDGMTAISGNVGDVKDTYEFYDKYDEKLRQYVLAHTDITPKEYDKTRRKQWFMTAEEMLKYGVVDTIL